MQTGICSIFVRFIKYVIESTPTMSQTHQSVDAPPVPPDSLLCNTSIWSS